MLTKFVEIYLKIEIICKKFKTTLQNYEKIFNKFSITFI